VGYAFHCNEVNSDITTASRLTGIYSPTRLREGGGSQALHYKKKLEK
jgi:hypothetical protein